MKPYIAAIALYMLALGTFAQSTTSLEDLTIGELQAPTSPAFTILGLNPEEISRPKSLAALEANITNNFISGNSVIIPNNLALEFMPYWLGKHDSLTLKQIMYPTFGQSMLQNMSVSVGTTGSSDSDMLPNEQFMSFGIRTLLFEQNRSTDIPKEFDEFIKNSDAVAKYHQFYQRFNSPLLSTIGLAKGKNWSEEEFTTALKSAFDNHENNIPMDEKKEFIAFREATLALIPKIFDADMNKLISKLQEKQPENQLIQNKKEELKRNLQNIDAALKSTYGWRIEIASAAVLQFPTGSINHSYLPKWGTWLTSTWQPKNSSWEFGGLVRIITNPSESRNIRNIDTGLKCSWIGNRFDVKGEWIYRTQKELLEQVTNFDGSVEKRTISRSDYKLAIRLDYRITDQILISYSFGQNFDVNAQFDSNVINLVGLNFGFNQAKIGDAKGTFR